MQEPGDGTARIAAATGGGYFEFASPGDVLGTFDLVIDELHQYALVSCRGRLMASCTS